MSEPGELRPAEQHILARIGDPASGEALAVAAWLEAKAGRSGSLNTARAYRATIASWQAALAAVQIGLAPPADPEVRDRWLAAVATVAQRWAGQGGVAPATYNRRCAIISSFYAFAARRGFFPNANPLTRVDRRRVQGYANAVAPGDA